MLVMRSAWRTFETDFQTTIDNLTRHTSFLDAEITFLHRKNIEFDIKEGNAFRQRTDKAFDLISQSTESRAVERPISTSNSDFESNKYSLSRSFQKLIQLR